MWLSRQRMAWCTEPTMSLSLSVLVSFRTILSNFILPCRCVIVPVISHNPIFSFLHCYETYRTDLTLKIYLMMHTAMEDPCFGPVQYGYLYQNIPQVSLQVLAEWQWHRILLVCSWKAWLLPFLAGNSVHNASWKLVLQNVTKVWSKCVFVASRKGVSGRECSFSNSYWWWIKKIGAAIRFWDQGRDHDCLEKHVWETNSRSYRYISP